MNNIPYLIEFGYNDNQVVLIKLQVMTGFNKPNIYVAYSRQPSFWDQESFDANIRDMIPPQSFTKRYPDQAAIDLAIETEILNAEFIGSVIDLLVVSEAARQDLANRLSVDPDKYLVNFGLAYNLITPRFAEITNIQLNETP